MHAHQSAAPASDPDLGALRMRCPSQGCHVCEKLRSSAITSRKRVTTHKQGVAAAATPDASGDGSSLEDAKRPPSAAAALLSFSSQSPPSPMRCKRCLLCSVSSATAPLHHGLNPATALAAANSLEAAEEIMSQALTQLVAANEHRLMLRGVLPAS